MICTELAAEVLHALILAVILVRTEWHMALLLLAFMPVIVALTLGFRSLARRVTRRGMQAMADVNSAIKETVSGISIAKNFRQEESIFRTFDAANQQSYRVNVRRGLVLSLVFPVMNASGGGVHGDPGVCGRHQRDAGPDHRRRVVPVPHEPGPVLLSRAEPGGLLGSDPAGLVGGRARVCADRRRSQRGADGAERGAAAARRGVLRAPAFPLFREGSSPFGLQPVRARRRDTGAGGAHRRRQVLDRETHRPLL